MYRSNSLQDGDKILNSWYSTCSNPPFQGLNLQSPYDHHHQSCLNNIHAKKSSKECILVENVYCTLLENHPKMSHLNFVNLKNANVASLALLYNETFSMIFKQCVWYVFDDVLDVTYLMTLLAPHLVGGGDLGIPQAKLKINENHCRSVFPIVFLPKEVADTSKTRSKTFMLF